MIPILQLFLLLLLHVIYLESILTGINFYILNTYTVHTDVFVFVFRKKVSTFTGIFGTSIKRVTKKNKTFGPKLICFWWSMMTDIHCQIAYGIAHIPWAYELFVLIKMEMKLVYAISSQKPS